MQTSVCYTKIVYIDKLKDLPNRLENISVTDYDYWIFLKALDSCLTKDSLIFLDPPYYLEGAANNLYKGHKEFNHVVLADRLHSFKSKCNILISYNDSLEVRRLYNSVWIIEEYDLPYSINKKTVGKELLIRNYT